MSRSDLQVSSRDWRKDVWIVSAVRRVGLPEEGLCASA